MRFKRFFIILTVLIVICLLFIPYFSHLIPRQTNFTISKFEELPPLKFRKNKNTERSIQIVNKAMQNEFSFQSETSSFPVIKSDIDQIWSYKFNNQSHRLYTHTLSMLWDIIYSHQQENKIEYLNLGKKIIFSWYNKMSVKDLSNFRFTWADHATSERLINIIYFVSYSKSFIKYSPAEEKIINRILEQSLYNLLEKNNYTVKHNHGLFQDVALALVIKELSSEKTKNKYTKVVVERFENQVNTLISSKGVEMENSPTYFFFLGELIHTFLPLVDNDLISPVIKNKISLLDRNANAFLGYDYKIKPIGDSNVANLIDFEKNTKEYFLIDPEAGFSIIKKKGIYFTARTKSLSPNHRHQDDLSFTYDVSNSHIINDTGVLNFEKSKEHDFSISPQAHNVCIPLEFVDNFKNHFESKIISFINNDAFFSLKIHAYYKEYLIERTFIAYNNASFLIVLDKIIKPKNSVWTNILNFDKDVVKINDFTWKSQQKFYISSLNKFDHKIASIKPMLGWKTEPFTKLIPNNTLFQAITSQNNVVFISLEHQVENISFGNNTLFFKYNNKNFYFSDFKNHIKLNDKLYPKTNVLNSKLEEIKAKRKLSFKHREAISLLLICMTIITILFHRNKYIYYLTLFFIVLLISAALFIAYC